MNELHCLYRFWDGADRLLYVGITNHLGRRIGQHEHGKSWWADVERVTVEHFPSREALAHAEAEAIKVERPLHNIIHNRVSIPKAPTSRSPRSGRSPTDWASEWEAWRALWEDYIERAERAAVEISSRLGHENWRAVDEMPELTAEAITLARMAPRRHPKDAA